jgi:hypothetical protein
VDAVKGKLCYGRTQGLPIRDAFDSSFDEVIQVDYQSLAPSNGFCPGGFWISLTHICVLGHIFGRRPAVISSVSVEPCSMR